MALKSKGVNAHKVLMTVLAHRNVQQMLVITVVTVAIMSQAPLKLKYGQTTFPSLASCT